jgi:excisionase family DNA binding protein
MLVASPGVLVPAQHCGTVARALGDWARRRYDTASIDPAVLVLVDELAAVAATTGPGQREATSPVAASRVVTVREMAEVLHLSERTIRRHCASGRLPAHRRAGRWLIEDGRP